MHSTDMEPTLSSEDGDDSEERPTSKKNWQLVRSAVGGACFWRSLAKESNVGSLLTYIAPGELHTKPQLQARPPLPSSDFAPAQLPDSPLPPRGTTSPMRAHGGLVSPDQRVFRRRVHRLGDGINARHAAIARGTHCCGRATPRIDFETPTGHVEHPLPFGSPRANLKEPGWSHCSSEGMSEMGEQAWLSKLREGRQPRTQQGTLFVSGLVTGHARPTEHHPMLSSLSRVDAEDGKGTDDGEDTFDSPQQDRVQNRDVVHLSHRLERIRWKERRCGPWTEEPEKMSEVPRLQRGNKTKHHHTQHMVQMTARQRANAAAGDATRTAEDFKCIAWLVDPDYGHHIPPDNFVPLMFWFGITRHYKTALRIFETAFGRGLIAPDKLTQLAPYCDVQVRLVEGFRCLARRESFEHLCEYLTDENRLRTWFLSMRRDPNGCIDIVELQNVLARMEVTDDKKVLFRFLSHFADVYTQGQSHPTSGEERMLPTERNRFGFHFFTTLLCRCVVTWCINHVLEFVDPPECLGSVESDVNGAEKMHRFARRWAELHRRIVVSFIVNHRYWGREGKICLMTLSQKTFANFGQELTPEQWLALFQRVRAQGMASTFPEGEEFNDPSFLKKKATSAVPI